MAAVTSDEIRSRALELAGSTQRDDAVAAVLALADGDRKALVGARNLLAHRLHGHPSDYAATAALTVLNRAVAELGWTDPYDWKIRWSQPLKRP